MDGIKRARRQFLRVAAAGVGSLALGACNGVGEAPGDSGDDSPTSTPAERVVDSGGTTSPPAPASFAWRITVDQALVLAAGTTVTIATGAGGMSAGVSPALPEGRTLSITGSGDLVIVSAAGAPPVDANGPWSIEVSSAT